jgi:hypothetical protein
MFLLLLALGAKWVTVLSGLMAIVLHFQMVTVMLMLLTSLVSLAHGEQTVFLHLSTAHAVWQMNHVQITHLTTVQQLVVHTVAMTLIVLAQTA